MAKARPQAPAVRFKLDPAYAPEALIAERLGLTASGFLDVRVRLFAQGFPIPDETTDRYDIEAVERWATRYSFDLATMGLALTGEPLAIRVKTYVAEDMPEDQSVSAGTIYVVGFDHYAKIGFTALPLKYRLRALQTAAPVRLVTYATFDGTRQQETALHSRFAALRLNGEWFRNEGALAAWIAEGCPT